MTSHSPTASGNHPMGASEDVWMAQALALATAQLGQTWPNPSVGAVVVQSGCVVGAGATARGGRPHAETVALAQAGDNAKGATLYVSLEPCSHHGKTPPCVDAIIQAGIAEVVIACGDPNPQVAGQGIAKLQAANIRVTEGIYAAEARELNRGFFSVIEKKRPYIAMKIALSADGKIAAAPGVRTQITGMESWQHSQQLRATSDAILTGIGTVLADDPLLTVRIPGVESRSPLRIVLDSHGRLPPYAQLVQSAPAVPLWVMTSAEITDAGARIPKIPGITLCPMEKMDPHMILTTLAQRGITRLLIEAGQGVNSSFLASGLVDRLYLYQSPQILGAQGLDAVAGGLNLNGWQCVEEVILENDRLKVFEKGDAP